MTFYGDVIENNSNNQGFLFSSIGKMLNLHPTKRLPSYDSARDLALELVDFFNDKVLAIRDSFPPTVISYRKDESRYSTELNEFSPTSTLEPLPLLKTMSGKSCILDPIPGGLMKDCYTILLPVIVSIINLSFDNATVPACFNAAVLDPILKKDSLNHEVHKNFRPISNLRFVSKATKKVVALRLNQHPFSNNLHDLRCFNQLIEWDKQLSLVFTMTFYSQSTTIVASYSCYWIFPLLSTR